MTDVMTDLSVIIDSIDHAGAEQRNAALRKYILALRDLQRATNQPGDGSSVGEEVWWDRHSQARSVVRMAFDRLIIAEFILNRGWDGT